MTLKHLMASGLIVMACMSCSSALSQLSPQEVTQTTESTLVTEATEATWGDDMTYSFLFDEEADVMAVIEAYFDANRRAHESRWQELISRIPEAADIQADLDQRAYVRYGIGNLAFVEVITSPHPGLYDVDATNHYVAVILGDKPRLIELPDKALFVHFAENIRQNPEKLKLENRIRTALILATGSGRREQEPTPTWTDEDGTLIIHYHRYVGDGGMARSILFDCTLTVDAEQEFTQACALSKAEVTRSFSGLRRNIDRTGTEYRELGIKSALKLATGSVNYELEPAPTWSDEEGTLVIRYNRYMSKKGMAQPSLHACTLTVDAEQEFTVACVNLDADK
ncbi:MAG: hypothetical protein FWC40_02845 [Proteobacteria bacterium]|nr:hypothetical protein [Pseudomonadota bacterium]